MYTKLIQTFKETNGTGTGNLKRESKNIINQTLVNCLSYTIVHHIPMIFRTEYYNIDKIYYKIRFNCKKVLYRLLKI